MNIELGHVRLGTLAAPVAKGPPSKEALRLRLYAALIAIDVAAILCGFAAANWIRFQTLVSDQSLNMCAALLPIYLGVALNSGSFNMEVLANGRRGLYRAATSLLVAVGAVLFIGFYLKASGDFSRFIFGLGTTASALFIVSGRLWFARTTRRLCGTSPLSEVVIIDGGHCDTPEGAYVLDAARAQLRPDLNDPMMLDRLGRYLKNADRVIVACLPERRRGWAMALKGANISGEVLAPELGELGAIGVNSYHGRATMQVSCGPLGLRDRVLKRGLDSALALGALLVLAPLMLTVAIVIKLETPGPVFFVQKRVGRGNRLFDMFKFRSMHVECSDHDGNRSAQRDDNRITRIGRFIRTTSIDELPQLLNILKGDMSFVGPRPHALGSTAEDKLFWEVDSRYWHRHASKPGLTGLAQIRGYRGATHNREDLTNRVQADLEYLAGWTIWRDIAIILATFRVIVHRNAY